MSGETAETAQTGGDTANRSHIVRSRVVSCSVLYGVCSHLTLGVRAGVGADSNSSLALRVPAFGARTRQTPDISAG
jgi:hypothetical protein